MSEMTMISIFVEVVRVNLLHLIFVKCHKTDIINEADDFS